MQIDCIAKVMLVGDTAIGKSSLLMRMVEDEFNPKLLPTIGIDFRYTVLKVGGKRVKLQVYDTAGQERFRAITYSYYRACSAIILVYDVSNRDSFIGLNKWLGDIAQYARKPLILLVGTKLDLPRKVSEHEAQALAQQLKCAWFECSAKWTRAELLPILEEIAREQLFLANAKEQPSLLDLEPVQSRRCCC